MTKTFTFDANGHAVELPHYTQLPTGLVRKYRSLDKINGTFAVIEELFAEDPDTLAAIDALPISDFIEMMKNWEKASGMDVGESSASSSS